LAESQPVYLNGRERNLSPAVKYQTASQTKFFYQDCSVANPDGNYLQIFAAVAEQMSAPSIILKFMTSFGFEKKLFSKKDLIIFVFILYYLVHSL
jgi:hypothetical protein